MNFVILIFENGDVSKVDQNHPRYAGIVADAKKINPYFIPYNDDTTAKFYDVIGNNFHTRYQVVSTTTTTTTTIK